MVTVPCYGSEKMVKKQEKIQLFGHLLNMSKNRKKTLRVFVGYL